MVLLKLMCALATLVALGCTPSSSSGPARPDYLDGTSDTGGGNGIENKAYEAYIVQPAQLRAFKNVLQPKLTELVALSPKPGLVLPYLQRWMLYKTWYIAPVSLGTISKDVIGVSFSPDNTQQLALQTKKSVWINSESFYKMTEQDQAVLILHEMVMSLYYLKYKSWSDICVEKIYPDIQCEASDIDVMNEIFPGTIPKPFTADDYENIREVTGVFMQPWRFSASEQLDQFLIQNSFDRRFTFGLGVDGNKPVKEKIIYKNNEKILAEELKNILTTAKHINQWPDECQGLRLWTKIDCLTLFQETLRRSKQGFDLGVLQIDIYSNPLLTTPIGGMKEISSSLEGSSIEVSSQHKKLYYFSMTPLEATKLVVGTPFRSLLVVLMEDLTLPVPQKTLLGFLSIPGVVTGPHPSLPGECVFVKPTVSTLNEDVLMISSKALGGFDRDLLRLRAATFPPFTTCREF